MSGYGNGGYGLNFGGLQSSITPLQLQGLIDALRIARMSGVREVQDQNGERIVYKSDQEVAAALAAAENLLASLLAGGQPQPKAIHFHTSKGLFGRRGY